MITMNNAMKFYKTNDLMTNDNSFSENMNAIVYNKMLSRVCGRYFMLGNFISNK